MEEIKIPLSKKKLYLMLVGSVIFVAIGILLISNPPKIKNPIFGNPTFIIVFSVIDILFFGLILILILKKIPENKPGFIINCEGIIDNSSGISSGLLLWKDIEEISTLNVVNQRFLMFRIKNPEEYINRQKGIIKKKGMEINYRSYGSPICISSNTLKINFDEFSVLVNQKFKKYR